MEGAQPRTEAEAGRDPSDRGKRELLSIAISVPDAKVKEEAWRRLHAERYGSLYLDEAAMLGFRWRNQRQLLAPFVENFFTQLPAIFTARAPEEAQAYFEALFPAYRVDTETIDRAQALLDSLEGPPSLTRLLIESIDEQQRALACRSFAASRNN
jgi:aminopeptidase N